MMPAGAASIRPQDLLRSLAPGNSRPNPLGEYNQPGTKLYNMREKERLSGSLTR